MPKCLVIFDYGRLMLAAVGCTTVADVARKRVCLPCAVVFHFTSHQLWSSAHFYGGFFFKLFFFFFKCILRLEEDMLGFPFVSSLFVNLCVTDVNRRLQKKIKRQRGEEKSFAVLSYLFIFALNRHTNHTVGALSGVDCVISLGGPNNPL